MRVLLAVDGTTASERSAEVVAAWARASAAEVHLFSVVDPEKAHETAMPSGFTHSLTPQGTASGLALSNVEEPHHRLAEDRTQAVTRFSAEREDYLAELRARCFDGLNTSARAGASSHTAQAIIDEATAAGADFIAMGTRARSGVGHALFGSIHEDVVRGAHVPVMLVGPGA